jgi:hypothetical protein
MLQVSQREMSKSLVICEMVSDTMNRLENKLMASAVLAEKPSFAGLVEESN